MKMCLAPYSLKFSKASQLFSNNAFCSFFHNKIVSTDSVYPVLALALTRIILIPIINN